MMNTEALRGRLLQLVMFSCSAACLAVPAETNAQQSESADTGVIEEIVVTARYREESLSKIGQSITAMNADQITSAGINDFADLARLTPSLSFAYSGPGRNTPLIRGLSSANSGQNDALQTPRVAGIYFDDVPVTSAMTSQRDVPFYDLQRVEVLRGPQGTLYGEGSIGGTIRYISADPDLQRLLTRFAGTVGHTRKAGDADYSVDASLSAPIIEDRLAIRVTGFRRYDAGYIDSIPDLPEEYDFDTTPQDDYNDRTSYGGRAVLLARPTENLTLRVVAHTEDNSGGGVGSVTGTAEDQINTFHPSPDTLDDTNDLVGLRISYDFPFGTLTSITGDYRRRLNRNGPQTAIADLFGGGNPVTTVDNRDHTRSQEVRFVSTFDGPLNFVGGVFYKDAFSKSEGRSVSTNPAFTVYDSQQNQSEIQYAVFGEIYYQLTPKLKLTGGLRYFNDEINVVNVNLPGSVLFPIGSEAHVSKTLDVVVPKMAAEYQANDDMLFYASLGRGARNGGINNVAVVASLPPDQRVDAATYDSDGVTAYEIGSKLYFLERKLYLETAVFHNDWTDFQVGIPAPFLSYVESLGSAHTQGIEGSIRWQVSESTALSAGGSLIEAELDSATPTAPEGASLLNVPDYNFVLSADTGMPLGSLYAFGRVSYTRTGEAYQSFTDQTSTSNSYKPPYGLLNLSIGIESERWSLTAHVDNVTNELPVVQNVVASLPGPLGDRFVPQPRSIRLTLRYGM